MKKVWVLDEPSLTRSRGLDLTAFLEPEEKTENVISPEKPDKAPKNPAMAFSLSLLVWGGGQFYLGKTRWGSAYLGAMVFCYVTAAVLIWFPGGSFWFGLPRLTLIFAALLILALGLILWGTNAVDAYYRTKSLRETPYLGTERLIWPLSMALLFPGWGQFVNGQPKKGIFFLLCGMAGLGSLLFLILSRQIWPLLGANPERQFFEHSVLGALEVLPVALLLWFVAAYDAFRSWEEFLRHRERSQMAGYRLNGREFLSDLVPQCSAVLGLMLAISLGMQFIPWRFYVDVLQRLRLDLLHHQLTIIPGLLKKIIGLVG